MTAARAGTAVPYSPEFYRDRQAGARSSARAILPIVLDLVPAQRIIDIGCGNGAWLDVAQELGIADVLGVDGPWVRTTELLFPPDRFRTCDLESGLTSLAAELAPTPSKRFDLALCMEVGEHLAPASGPMLVAALARLSDVVVFSAAIPLQGGTGHVNERWPADWAVHFADVGLHPIDAVRRRVWDAPDIEWWYAQNVVIYASDGALELHPRLAEARRALLAAGIDAPQALVHPGCFTHHMLRPMGLRRIVAELPGAVSSALRAKAAGALDAKMNR